MRFSVVIPCYNQGRFLIDCLESLAYQLLPPWEVFVVDDGSTDAETVELCARLPRYCYPFHLCCLRKPNGGLASARNYGIRQCVGDVILPLDADDKLTPNAIEEYAKLFTSEPEVDICYPDLLQFGNDDAPWYTPPFNRWRLTQENIMVCSSAIRRRVFDAGYWYDEEKRHGCEDWEFWMRTCALGSFRAAPLRKAVFVYRRWGYSMMAGIDLEATVSFIREKHRRIGIWSAQIDQQLRTREAPTHRLVSNNPSEVLLPSDDIAPLSARSLEHFLKTDQITRFIWFGSFPGEATVNLQLIVNEVARHSPRPVYLFLDSHTSRVYLTVFDRLAVLQDGSDFSRLAARVCPLLITTSGNRQPYPVSVGNPDPASLLSSEAVALLCNRVGSNALPAGHQEDVRINNNIHYYYHRQPAIPRPAIRSARDRILAIAMPWLTHGGGRIRRANSPEGRHDPPLV